MEAIILAGGFGTRLSHIVNDVPKPMASVAGNPFLLYIVDDLIVKGISKIVFAVGYKKEVIFSFFGSRYKNCEIDYSIEEKPLCTGGAIKKALEKCSENKVFVINGDTYFDVDLQGMLVFHQCKTADVTIASKKMHDFDRYGTLKVDGERIIRFEEKKKTLEGQINGGIYLIDRFLLETVNETCFSFESNFMEPFVGKYKMYMYLSEGYFIDIGVEEDYFKAQKDFSIFRQKI